MASQSSVWSHFQNRKKNCGNCHKNLNVNKFTSFIPTNIHTRHQLHVYVSKKSKRNLRPIIEKVNYIPVEYYQNDWNDKDSMVFSFSQNKMLACNSGNVIKSVLIITIIMLWIVLQTVMIETCCDLFELWPIYNLRYKIAYPEYITLLILYIYPNVDNSSTQMYESCSPAHVRMSCDHDDISNLVLPAHALNACKWSLPRWMWSYQHIARVIA